MFLLYAWTQGDFLGRNASEWDTQNYLMRAILHQERFMFFCQKADLHVTCTQQSNFYATFHCAFYPKAEMASKLSL